MHSSSEGSALPIPPAMAARLRDTEIAVAEALLTPNGRQLVLEGLERLLGLNVAAMTRPVRIPERGWDFERFEQRGMNAAGVKAYMAFCNSSSTAFQHYDPLRPQREQRNQVLTMLRRGWARQSSRTCAGSWPRRSCLDWSSCCTSNSKRRATFLRLFSKCESGALSSHTRETSPRRLSCAVGLTFLACGATALEQASTSYKRERDCPSLERVAKELAPGTPAARVRALLGPAEYEPTPGQEYYSSTRSDCSLVIEYRLGTEITKVVQQAELMAIGE
jgi:hypothetical protein